VSTEHPLAQQEHVELAMFANDPFITPPISAGSVLYEDTIRACADVGFQPIISQQITDPYMSMMLVAAGMGVAYLPEGVATLLPPGATFVELRGESVFMNHGLAWSRRKGSLARDAFVELVDRTLSTT